MSTDLGWGRKRLINKIILDNWQISQPEKMTFKYSEALFLIQELLTEEGKPYMELGTKPSGFTIFRHFVKHLLYRNLANYDSMVLVTSEKGTGKSSAAIMMAREWCKMIGIRFNPARHIAYNNADVMNKIDMLKKFEPLICDEAIRFASACITGNTLIKTPAGNIPIKLLENKSNFEVYSYNEQTKKEEIQLATKCLKIRNDIVYELETEDGKKIQATKEHKFLTTQGWKRLEDLKEGDDLIGI